MHAIYHIQHLYGNRKCKVVHFDRLKPCTSEVTLTVNQHQITQDCDQPTKYAASSTNVPLPLGTNLELLDDDDGQTTLESDSALSPSSPSPPPAERRYPARSHHPPTRFNDFISH